MMSLPKAGSDPGLEAALRQRVRGEVAFDPYTRHLFSTDASMYAIEPVGVVSPRDADDVVAAVRVAAEHGAAVLPRGGGTSLAGQTTGRAVVLDLSRHMSRILEIDPEARTARVQPGVVQDDLNRAVRPHGLLFAPDTSTSSRATIGGMIGNNSCGSRSARYGMTVDHVEALEVVLSDGSRARLEALDPEEIQLRSREHTLEGKLYREIPPLIDRNAGIIRDGMPEHWRRSGGYRVERLLKSPLNLSHVVVGSEGTLAVVVEATVRLVPVPVAISALVGHFESVTEAIRAGPAAMDEGATAVELVDRMILDLARESPVHGHLAARLEGDPGAILWIECYGESREAAAAGMRRVRKRWEEEGRGYAIVEAESPEEQKGFRELRKAGLGLLMNAGWERQRSIAFVEDTAVDPSRLAEYAERFAGILEGHGLRAGFYGHASAGTLHIRPFMDLRRPGDVEVLEAVAEAVFQLVQEFDGMNSSEHGDGLARGGFNRRFFGEELYGVMQEMKRIFDPEVRLNPGKKVDVPEKGVRVPDMTEDLRDPALAEPEPPETYLHFDFEDGMRGAANRCQRIGACRKSPGAGGVMCPSYMATREEEHSTRGRANALVRALSMPDPGAALRDPRLHEILDLCLECKACQTECPLSVDMAALKSEALAQRWDREGAPLRARIFGHVRTLNRIGSALAPLSNLPGAIGPLRALLEWTTGIDRRRPLPRFRRDTLPKWFRRWEASQRRSGSAGSPEPSRSRGSRGRESRGRGRLLFLADSFTSFTEPEIGRAAVELLEMAGWTVELVDELCCGRALISKGLLEQARSRQEALLDRLAPAARDGVPIVGCEPSCVFTLHDELGPLTRRFEDAEAVAKSARMVDELLCEALDDGGLSPDPDSPVAGRTILFHGHCHQKAAGGMSGSVDLLRKIPGATVNVLDAGCCGMAGSFGFEKEHYDLSLEIGGQRLFPFVENAGDDALIAATGVSCRQQIAHGTSREAQHPVVLLRRACRAEPAVATP